MQQTFIEKIKISLNEKSILKNISGWIFTNFHNRDLLTNNLLNINSKEVSTRRWVYIVNKNGNPIKILHKIEKESLSHLSGETFYYSSQKELVSILKSVCKKNTFAILKDKNIAVISTVDSGFVELLDKAKIKTVSASSLVQLTKGTLSDSQIESQKKVAEILYKTIFNAWDFIKQHFKNKKILTEMDVEQFILREFAKNDIETDHPPIVAFGKNSGNPHYEVTNENNAICKVGDVIQLDIWGKLKNIENSVYADISWVGIYDTKVPNNVQECFNCLISARDSVLTTLNSNNKKLKGKITGSFLDKQVRKILINAGYEKGIKHRTGHGIDTEVHGSGANLDSVEFPDNRFLFSGCSFSVEPGLYFEDFGLRTEIDITIKDGKAFIPGNDISKPKEISIPQLKILTC